MHVTWIWEWRDCNKTDGCSLFGSVEFFLVCCNLLVSFLFAFYSQSHSRLWNFRFFFCVRGHNFFHQIFPSSASTLPHYRNQAVKLVKGWKFSVHLFASCHFASCLNECFHASGPKPWWPRGFPSTGLMGSDQAEPADNSWDLNSTWSYVHI